MSDDRLELILRLVSEQAGALVCVGGVVWEGTITSCLFGELVAVARPVGARVARSEQRWRLQDVSDLAPLDAGERELPVDELQEQARELARHALERRDEPLAVRLARQRLAPPQQPQ